MKIGIGIPNRGTINTVTMENLIAIMFDCFLKGHSVQLITLESTYVDWGRVNCVRKAQQAGCDRLLFVDTDMEFESHALSQLLSHDKPIIGVNYFTRDQTKSVSTIKLKGNQGPTGETRRGSVNDLPSEVFEVFAVGTGFMLIDMKVFEKTPQPWFRNTYDGETGDFRYGDDVWFCKQAIAAGFSVWCDPTLIIGHRGSFLYMGQPSTQVDIPANPTRASLDSSVVRLVRDTAGAA